MSRVCIVCKAPVVDGAPREDRWSWGPDGAHCHQRCESGFWQALETLDRSTWLCPPPCQTRNVSTSDSCGYCDRRRSAKATDK